MRGRSVCTLVLLLWLACMLLIPVVQGLGLTTDPLFVDDALKGESYWRQIRVYQNLNYSGVFNLYAEGDGSSWITFYRLEDVNRTESLTNVTIPAESFQDIRVVFSIPGDAASGAYTPEIFVEALPPNVTGGVGVSHVMSVDVTMNVTGEQTLSGVVRSVTTANVETGEPVNISVEFENTGNVQAKPLVEAAVFKSGVQVGSIAFSDTWVPPGERELLTLSWNTTGRELGNYSVLVNVSLDDTLLVQRTLVFQIFPYGELTTVGELSELLVEGELAVGNTVKIIGRFHNGGRVNVPAKFVGEVYHDDRFVRNITSEEVIVGKYQTESLVSYLMISEDGNYRVSGYVLYKDKKTQEASVDFVVGNALMWIVAGGGVSVGGMVLIGMVYYVTQRRNNNGGSVSLRDRDRRRK